MKPIKTVLCLLFFFIPFFLFGQSGSTYQPNQYRSIADSLLGKYKYDSASIYYLKAAQLYKQESNWLNCVKNYRLTASALLNTINYDTSLFYANTALDLAEKHFRVDNRDEILEKTDCLLILADLKEKKGKYREDLIYCKNALGLLLKTDSLAYLKIAGIWNKTGLAYSNLGELDSALWFCNKALEVRLKLLGEQNIVIAESNYSFGTIYLKKAEMDIALDYMQKALKIRIMVLGEQHTDVASIYNYIGVIYDEKGEYDQALDYLQKALKIDVLTLGEQHPDISREYLNIGCIYEEKADYDKALEYFQKALKIRIAALGPQHPEVAICYNNIGSACERKKEYDKALEYHQKALAIRKVALGEQHLRVAYSYNNIGVVYEYKGEYDKALEYYQKALTISIKTLGEKHINVAHINNNIGVIFRYKKNYDKALEYYKKALKIRIDALGEKHPESAITYQYIGELYCFKGEYSKALINFQKGLIANLPGFTDTSVYSNPKLENILSKPNLLLSLTSKADALYLQYKHETKLYTDLQASLSTYELAFQLINNMRNESNLENTKLLLSEEIKKSYVQATNIAMELSQLKPAENNNQYAFGFIEKSKSTVLAAQFNEIEAKHAAGIPDSLLHKEKELKINLDFYRTAIDDAFANEKGFDTVKINALENKKFDCSRQYDSLIAYFESAYPAYYEFKYNRKTSSVADLKQMLDNKTCILDYFVGDSFLFIAVITDSLYHIEKVEIDSLFKELVIGYFTNIKTAEPQSFATNSQLIYEKLLLPVKKYIDPKNHLLIMPDDYLHYLPFETLISDSKVGEVKGDDYSKLDYLIKHYTVSYHQSATLWYNSKTKEQNQRTKTNENFIGFAPVFSKKANNGLILSNNIHTIDTIGNQYGYRSITKNLKEFNPLPFSEKEVASIVKLFEQNNKTAIAYLYKEANESNFKKNIKGYRYVHVSSHGFSNNETPSLSGIAFSQPDSIADTGDDGILYAGETYNLSINADLLVLSSCESGMGKLFKSEGLMAISRGFLYAGTPNIIFTLWKTLDEPAKNLMVECYSNILEGKTYAEALKQAKLKLLSNPGTSFPFFWSGFVLVGR